ncbi:MAG: response regulator [Cyclobacteriaceae bacterium]
MQTENSSVWILGAIAGGFILIPSMVLPFFSGIWLELDWLFFSRIFSLVAATFIGGLTYLFANKAREIREMNETHNKLILNNLPNCVWVFSLNDRMLRSSNKASADIFSWTEKDQGQKSFEALFYKPEIVEQIMQGKRCVFRNIVMIDRNYDPRYMDLFAIPFQSYDQPCVLVLVVDQSEMQKSLEKIKALSDSVHFQNKKLREFSFINSHKIRSHLANILGIVDVQEGNHSLSGELLDMLKASATQLDVEIRKINSILMENGISEIEAEQKEKTIVFVDDDKVQHMINKRILLKINNQLNLVFFENPYDALEWLKENQADVILLDINMPQMDGWHFLDLMKKKGIDIDVKMLTSSLDPGDLEKSKNYPKVSGFLVKPLKNENIENFLAN